MSNKISRRDLLRMGLSGAALAVLSRCLPRELRPEASLSPSLESTADAATAAPKLLGNENRPGFYIRYIKRFAPLDRAAWRLNVTGLVRNPQELSLADLKQLSVMTQRSRMKCVEGWSAAAKWEGFHPQTLIDLVEPQAIAQWVHFRCADGYYESLPLEELLMPRTLFAYRMNDADLLDEYGAPLRLIVPPKYGYKGPKALLSVTFADKELKGYWPTVGPYSTEGDIAPGGDYALDLGDARTHGRGEVFYPDGLESKD